MIHIHPFVLYHSIGYDIKKVDIENNQLAIDLYHHVVEAIKFGYAQRTFLGDPEFVNVTEVCIIIRYSNIMFADPFNKGTTE